MADFKFEWDYEAAGDLLLRSEEIAAFCEEEAAKMTRATGVEYVADVVVGKKRVRAGAYTDPDNENITYKKKKFERDPETGWPICTKCGKAHYWCTCWHKKV